MPFGIPFASHAPAHLSELIDHGLQTEAAEDRLLAVAVANKHDIQFPEARVPFAGHQTFAIGMGQYTVSRFMQQQGTTEAYLGKKLDRSGVPSRQTKAEAALITEVGKAMGSSLGISLRIEEILEAGLAKVTITDTPRKPFHDTPKILIPEHGMCLLPGVDEAQPYVIQPTYSYEGSSEGFRRALVAVRGNGFRQDREPSLN